MKINELDKLSYQDLNNLYILLKNFNSYPKGVRKQLLKQLREKMEEKRDLNGWTIICTSNFLFSF